MNPSFLIWLQILSQLYYDGLFFCVMLDEVIGDCLLTVFYNCGNLIQMKLVGILDAGW